MRTNLNFSPLFRSSIGLSALELKRQIPEAAKPHRIEIATEAAPPQFEMHQIETQKAVA